MYMFTTNSVYFLNFGLFFNGQDVPAGPWPNTVYISGVEKKMVSQPGRTHIRTLTHNPAEKGGRPIVDGQAWE